MLLLSVTCTIQSVILFGQIALDDLPDTLEHDDPIPCNARAINSTSNDLPNAKTIEHN